MEKETEGRRQIASLHWQLAAVIAALALPSMAGADEFPPDVVGVLAGESKPAEQLTFVGVSGQLYFPGSGTWKRRHAGGIASNVLGAVRSGDTVYAVSRRAPMFRLEAGTWRATPLANRGRASFVSEGKTVMASLGRHLYRFDKGKWNRLATASRRVTAIYPAAKNRVYVATTRGRLRRTDGKSFQVVKNPLPVEDYVLQFAGRPGKELYGLSKDGVLLTIGAAEAKVLVPEGPLAGLTVDAMGSGPKGKILAAGTVPSAEGGRSAVLVSLAGGAATLERPLWPLATGDRTTVIHTAAGGELVVATYGGRVGVLQTDGSWKHFKVSGAPPALQVTQASNRPAVAP